MSQAKLEPKRGSALNNLPIVYKQMLTLLVISGCTILALYLFFLPQLAEERLEQLQSMGRSQAVLVSQMTLNALYNRDQQELAKALEEFKTDVLDQQEEFIQISVILHPTGIYYASTKPEFVGQKGHSSLLEQLDATPQDAIFSLEIPYQTDAKVTRVYQFLKAINIPKEDELVRIGTVQVLIGYDRVLMATGNNLIFHGFWITALGMLLLWAYHLPLSAGLNRLTLAIKQVGNGQLEQEQEVRNNDELGRLLITFNQTLAKLKHQQQTQLARRLAPERSQRSNQADYSLRKADLTCLCARIPGAPDWIANEQPEAIAKHLNEYLESFEQHVSELGGQVVQVIGNKVYTLFEGINGINNALRASIKLSKLWKEQNHQRKVLGQKQLDYGIGIHAAAGVAGTLGQKKGNYTFVSLAAAIAEHLCAAAGKEEVLVTSSTLERSSVHFQQQQVTELKNRSLSELDEIFRLLDAPVTPKKKKKAESEGSTDLQNGFESLVPDMLEETLRAAPLDLNLEEEPPLEDWNPEDIDASGSSFWDDVNSEGHPKKKQPPED